MLCDDPRMSPLIRSIGIVFAGLAFAILIASCGEPTRSRGGATSASPSPGPFDAAVQCRPGEEDGAQYWEYGANPRGTIDDLLENVVLAKDDSGSVVAFVEFGKDDDGRYLPNYAETCASTGIEEFG
jgi:hypothetical protein